MTDDISNKDNIANDTADKPVERKSDTSMNATKLSENINSDALAQPKTAPVTETNSEEIFPGMENKNITEESPKNSEADSDVNSETLADEVTTIPEAKQLTRARAHDLRGLVTRYFKRHLPKNNNKKTQVGEPPRMVGNHAKTLVWLQTIPWILLVLFAGSFFWDFDNIYYTIFDYTLNIEGLLRITAVSGLIGFITNWVAITMLFQPRQKRPIFGQGLIPAQRERVIFRLAKAVSEELINAEIIKQKIEESGVITKYKNIGMDVVKGVLEDDEFREDLKKLTSDYARQMLGSEEFRKKLGALALEKIQEQAGQGIGGMALKAYRFFKEDDLQQKIDQAILELPDTLDHALDSLDVYLDKLPAKIDEHADEFETQATNMILSAVEGLDIYGMISGNMRDYDEAQLENLIKSSSNEQLNYIKYLGGILGFIGGLVIWEPVLFLGAFAVIGFSLWGLDTLIFNLQQPAE